jgi:hypothetical protein
VEPQKSGYHDQEFIYPVGFRSSRKYLSVVNPSAKCLYYSEVVEGTDGEPVFRVTCEQDQSEPIEDKSADVSPRPNEPYPLPFAIRGTPSLLTGHMWRVLCGARVISGHL